MVIFYPRVQTLFLAFRHTGDVTTAQTSLMTGSVQFHLCLLTIISKRDANFSNV